VACYTVTVKNTDEAIDDDDFPVLMQVCQKHRHEKGTLCNGIAALFDPVCTHI
jgi:hypothetical protein